MLATLLARPRIRRQLEPRTRRLANLGLAALAAAAAAGLTELLWPGLLLGSHPLAPRPALQAACVLLAVAALYLGAFTASVWVVARASRGGLSLLDSLEVAALALAAQALALPLLAVALAVSGLVAGSPVLALGGVLLVLGTQCLAWACRVEAGAGGLVARSLGTLVLIAVLAGFIPSWTRPLRVAASNMRPTLAPGDLVQTSLLGAEALRLRRGDLVTYTPPGREKPVSFGRIVGLPGETIQVFGAGATIDGEVGRDEWGWEDPEAPARARELIRDHGPFCTGYAETPIPAEHYFLLGDNRLNSQDSRFFGAVPAARVQGLAYYLYFPLDRAVSLGQGPGPGR